MHTISYVIGNIDIFVRKVM